MRLPFQKKKLNLREIHQLYLLLKPCLPEKEEEFMIDEVDEILERVTPEILTDVLRVLKVNMKNKQGIEVLTLLIKGLKHNSFFEYAHFVRGMNGR